MSLISPLLEVPPWIEKGLKSGEFFREGGIIRRTANGEIAAHLKEVGNPGDLMKMLDAALSPRHSQAMGQFSSLLNLSMIGAGIGLINLGVSVVTLAVMIKRFNDIEKKIDELFEEFKQEFEQDRESNLQAGLMAAENAATAALAGDSTNAREYAGQAIDRLIEAQVAIRKSVAHASRGGDSRILLAQLTRAMQVDALLVRCFLEREDFANANKLLSDALKKHRVKARVTITRLLGNHRAVYFHPTVSDEDLWRFVEIRRWLSDREIDRNALLAEAVLAERRDFWNHDVIADMDAVSKRRSMRERLSRKSASDYEDMPRHLRALSDCEGVIENYRRMQGYQAEFQAIERLGISHREWQQAQDEALAKAEINLAEYDGYVLLVNTEYLESLDRKAS